MRLLITGGRAWTDAQMIRDAIDDVLLIRDLDPSEVTFIEGEARGADTIGRDIALEMGMTIEAYPAQWETYGRSAGPIRNKQMIDSKPDLAIAFLQPGSKGTKNCIKQCQNANIPVVIYEEAQ